MPFEDVDIREETGLLSAQRIEPPPEQETTFPDLAKASIRQTNALYNTWQALTREQFKPDPTHNPRALIEGTKYWRDHRDLFADSVSVYDTLARMDQIDQEETDRRYISAAGFPGWVTSVAAGMVSPEIAMPVGAAVRGVRGGYSLWRTMAATGVAGAAQAGVAEVALQAGQQTRTALESAEAVGSATILSGLLGAGVARLLTSAERATFTRALDQMRADIDAHTNGTVARRGIRDDFDELTIDLGAEKKDRFRQRLATDTPETTLSLPPGVSVRIGDIRADDSRAPVAVTDADGRVLYEATLERARMAFSEGEPVADYLHVQHITRSQEDITGIGLAVYLDIARQVRERFGLPLAVGASGDTSRSARRAHARLESLGVLERRGEGPGGVVQVLEPTEAAARFAPSEVGAASVGAAAADTRQLELVGTGLGWTARTSPTRFNLSAESVQARRITADTFEAPYRFQGGEGPNRVPVDRLARMAILGTRSQWQDTYQRAYADYRFGDESITAPIARAQIARVTGGGEGKLTPAEFKQQVSVALNNQDKHEIPQVEATAKWVRENVLTPWAKRAQELAKLNTPGFEAFKELSEDQLRDYMSRIWNKQAIRANRPAVVNKFVDYFKNDQETKARAKERLTALNDQLSTWGKRISRLEGRMATAERRAERIGTRLDERAMEVRRAEARSDTLAEQAMIDEEIQQTESWIEDLRAEVGDPALQRELDALRDEVRALRKAERPATEADLRKIEEQELGGILTGQVRMAAEMLTGRRSWPKAPSFVSWLVAGGGIKDTGGDVASILGGTRVRPGLLNQRGLPLDRIAERIKEEAPGWFPHRDEPGGGLPSHQEILEWIDSSLRGREPDWWVEALSDADKSKIQAAKLAAAMDRTLSEAGVDVKNIRDVAKILRDEKEGGISLEDLDRIAADMEAAGQAIPMSIRRGAAEEQLFVGVDTVRELRDLIRVSMRTRDSRRQQLRIARERGEEASIVERAGQGRLSILDQQLSRVDQQRDLLRRAQAIAAQHRDDIRTKIEAEIAAWEGRSSGEAKAAIRAREKYEFETFRREQDGEQARLTMADDAIDRTVKRIIESDRDLSDADLRERAHQTVERILGSPDGRLPYDVHMGGPVIGGFERGSPPRGPMAARDFAIKNEAVWDFIETDVDHIINYYMRTMVPDVLLAERFGDVEMTVARQAIDEDYRRLIDQVPPNSKRAQELDAEHRGVITRLAGMRDRVRHVYGWDGSMEMAGRTIQVVKNINNLTSMGVAALSSLPDLAGVIFRHGLSTTFRDGYAPFIAHLTGGEGWSKAQSQWRAVGLAVETQTAFRQHSIDDAFELYRPGTRFERGLQWATDKFFIANMLAPFTDFAKTVAANVASGEILRGAEAIAAGKASKRQIDMLREAGIDAFMAERIARNFREGGGEVIDGVRVPNTAQWADREAAEFFNAAVARDAEIAVVTPGQEKPLTMSQPVWSMLTQFKSFTASATERILIANIQRRDANVLSGLIFSLGLGMLSYKLQSVFGGHKTSDKPADWVKEGISRAGVLGWFEEGNAMAAKMTRGTVDVYRLVGSDKPLSRYVSRNAADMLLGPTAGKLQRLTQITGAAATGDWKESDTKAVRQITFLQNLFWLRGVLNQVEAGVNGKLGVEMRPPPQ